MTVYELDFQADKRWVAKLVPSNIAKMYKLEKSSLALEVREGGKAGLTVFVVGDVFEDIPEGASKFFVHGLAQPRAMMALQQSNTDNQGLGLLSNAATASAPPPAPPPSASCNTAPARGSSLGNGMPAKPRKKKKQDQSTHLNIPVTKCLMDQGFCDVMDMDEVTWVTLNMNNISVPAINKNLTDRWGQNYVICTGRKFLPVPDSAETREVVFWRGPKANAKKFYGLREKDVLQRKRMEEAWVNDPTFEPPKRRGKKRSWRQSGGATVRGLLLEKDAVEKRDAVNKAMRNWLRCKECKMVYGKEKMFCTKCGYISGCAPCTERYSELNVLYGRPFANMEVTSEDGVVETVAEGTARLAAEQAQGIRPWEGKYRCLECKTRTTMIKVGGLGELMEAVKGKLGTSTSTSTSTTN